MPTHDIHNRPYVKLSQLKPNDLVIVDGNFTCIKPWSTRVVKSWIDKNTNITRLYIRCCGDTGIISDRPNKQHFLDGQVDGKDYDTLIGVYLKKDFIHV